MALLAAHARQVGHARIGALDFTARRFECRPRQQHAFEAAMHIAAVVLRDESDIKWRLLTSGGTSLLQQPLDRLTERTEAIRS